MQLSAIKLITITLDSDTVIKYFGEPVVFYMHSDVDINTYFDLYRLQSTGISNELMALIKTIIRDKDGSLLLDENETIPTMIVPDLVRAIIYQMDQVRNQTLNPNGDWLTAQLVTIGAIAKEYGVLPHVIRDTATTYDLMIFDITNTWERYQYNKASGKNVDEPNVEQMKAMLAAVKGNKDDEHN